MIFTCWICLTLPRYNYQLNRSEYFYERYEEIEKMFVQVEEENRWENVREWKGKICRNIVQVYYFRELKNVILSFSSIMNEKTKDCLDFRWKWLVNLLQKKMKQNEKLCFELLSSIARIELENRTGLTAASSNLFCNICF